MPKRNDTRASGTDTDSRPTKGHGGAWVMSPAARQRAVRAEWAAFVLARHPRHGTDGPAGALPASRRACTYECCAVARACERFTTDVVRIRLGVTDDEDALAKLNAAEAFERTYGRAAVIAALEAARPDELSPALAELLSALRTVAA